MKQVKKYSVCAVVLLLILVFMNSLFARALLHLIHFNVGVDGDNVVSSITYGRHGYEMILKGNGYMTPNFPEEWQGELVNLSSGWKIALKKVSVQDGISSLPSGIFSGCSKLGYVQLPSSLQIIGMKAFSYCYELKAIEYDGTIDEWINLANNSPLWNDESFVNVIQCANGEWYVGE